MLLIYFLLNTGVIFEVTRAEHEFGDLPTSIALSSYRIDGNYFSRQEISAVEWVHARIPEDKRAYGDWYGRAILQGQPGPWQARVVLSNAAVPRSHLVFLRSHNINNDQYRIRDGLLYTNYSKDELPLLVDAIDTGHLIYANSGARVIAAG